MIPFIMLLRCQMRAMDVSYVCLSYAFTYYSLEYIFFEEQARMIPNVNVFVGIQA